jgi:hypothetical protein
MSNSAIFRLAAIGGSFSAIELLSAVLFYARLVKAGTF